MQAKYLQTQFVYKTTSSWSEYSTFQIQYLKEMKSRFYCAPWKKGEVKYMIFRCLIPVRETTDVRQKHYSIGL